MSESMSEITSKLPTHDELVDIILKIADFAKKFFTLFDALQKGFEQGFYGYKSVFGNGPAAAEE
jgi:hypothetical protein